MHIGLLGTGFGMEHAKLYKMMKNVNEVTVFGRNEEKLKRVKNEMGFKVTSNIEDIFNEASIDLVDICLPSHLHAQYAIKALENNKHVLIETPAALNLDEIRGIVKASKSYQKKAYVNMFIRFENYYEYLYDLNKKGTYGELKALNIYRKTPGIWGDLGLDTIHTSLMIHEFDFVTWLLGKPKEIEAYGIENIKGTKACIDAALIYETTLVHINANSMMPEGYPFSVGYEAVFEDGLLLYEEDGYKDREELRFELYSKGVVKNIQMKKENCYAKVLEHVVKDIENNNYESSLYIDEAMISLEAVLEMKEKLS